jgi:anti-anti-sigma regulatory factor
LQQQRPTFEQAVRAEGIKDFVIFDRVSGSKAPASNRPFYYPVHYIEPYAGNEGAVGFDLYSEPQRRQAIDRALSEGKMQSTGRISLVQESGAQYGLLLFAPVGIAPDGLKATEGSGFALGVLRVSQLVSTAAVAIEDKIVLLDRSAPEGEQLLHPRLADESAAIASLGTQAARHPLKIGGRDLDIFVSIPSFEPASGKYLSVLVLGLLGFGGMSMFVYRSSRVTARAMHSSRELQKALEEIEQSREALQASQDLLRREIYDLSAPILHLGKRVIALPIVGQLSEERMGQIMSVLLDAVSQHQTSTAIIDLAGVKGASSIAPHWILKTSDAASLMGVRTIVTSLSPEMVRTFIESGVDTARLNFKSSLGEAIAKHEN